MRGRLASVHLFSVRHRCRSTAGAPTGLSSFRVSRMKARITDSGFADVFSGFRGCFPAVSTSPEANTGGDFSDLGINRQQSAPLSFTERVTGFRGCFRHLSTEAARKPGFADASVGFRGCHLSGFADARLRVSRMNFGRSGAPHKASAKRNTRAVFNASFFNVVTRRRGSRLFSIPPDRASPVSHLRAV